MRAWCSFSHRQTHPYRRFRLSDVQNASVVLIVASQNAPLSQISLLGCPKCERGAHFCIAKRTPIEDFAPRMSRMRAWWSFLHPQTHPYRRFRAPRVISYVNLRAMELPRTILYVILRTMGFPRPASYVNLHAMALPCAISFVNLCTTGFPRAILYVKLPLSSVNSRRKVLSIALPTVNSQSKMLLRALSSLNSKGKCSGGRFPSSKVHSNGVHHTCLLSPCSDVYIYIYIHPNNGQKGSHDPKDRPIVGHESAALPRTRYTTRGREAAEYTQNSPVALYTHLFRFKVSFDSRCSLIGKARVE